MRHLLGDLGITEWWEEQKEVHTGDGELEGQGEATHQAPQSTSADGQVGGCRGIGERDRAGLAEESAER